MIHYLAIALGGDGGIVRHPKTQQVKATAIGEFDSMADAINQACQQFDCTHLLKGVISKGQGLGGYMVVNSQEFAEL